MAGHPALPLLGRLHAALLMKFAHFSLGPIMFSFRKALNHRNDRASRSVFRATESGGVDSHGMGHKISPGKPMGLRKGKHPRF